MIPRRAIMTQKNDPDVHERLPKRFLEPFACVVFVPWLSEKRGEPMFVTENLTCKALPDRENVFDIFINGQTLYDRIDTREGDVELLEKRFGETMWRKVVYDFEWPDENDVVQN